MDLIPYKPNLIVNGKGLVNATGVSCYYNSLIQALLSCSSLYPFIREYNGTDIFITAFRDLWISELINKKGCDRTIYVKELKEIAEICINEDLKSLYYKYENNIINEDVFFQLVESLYHDVNNNIKKAIEEEDRKYKNTPNPTDGEVYNHAYNASMMRDLHMEVGRQEDTTQLFISIYNKFTNIPEITRLFTHRIRRTINCNNCNKSYHNYIDNNYFQFSQDLTEGQLNKFIIKFDDNSDKDLVCSLCNNKGVKKMTYNVVMIPEIIMISFNKYPGHSGIVKKKATPYPKELFLPASKSQHYQYKLVATIDQRGDNDGGHYVANVLRADWWWHMDDASAAELPNGAPNPHENTYVLFYHYEKIIRR